MSSEFTIFYLFAAVALDFVKYGLKNNLIVPGTLQETVIVRLFTHYRNYHPSSVKSSEIVEALRETCLIKKSRSQTDSGSNVIEFKDQIFNLPGGSMDIRLVLVARILSYSSNFGMFMRS